MAEQLFKKAAVMGDLHFGKKNNSRQFNLDCQEFVHWFIDEAKAWGADTVIFVGDWHDSRRFINISTLNYSLSSMEAIDKEFNWYFIPGNHDLFYRDKREISSIEIARNLKNVRIVRDPEVIGNVAFFPWLVGDEWKQIPKYKGKYVFGHFELPHFLMNAMVEMPDHGTIKHEDFQGADYVFSGHFHKRQQQNNIIYIGSPFPHNFADAWDDERGMMFLEWGGTPEFKKWPGAPTYRTMKLSELMDNPTQYITDKTYARVYMDLEVNYEEAQFLKDTFAAQYSAREMNMIPVTATDDDFEWGENVQFQSVDQIVTEGLNSVESATIDPQKLISIYNGLNV